MKNLTFLSIFGHPVSFQLNEKIIYKSFIGVIVTLIIFVIGLFVFI